MDAEFEEVYIDGLSSAKRASIRWTPRMGDWFVSNSPRNGNSNAEGTWEHWVELSLSILQHPATSLVRPDVHERVSGLQTFSRYSDTERPLTDEELDTLFRQPKS